MNWRVKLNDVDITAYVSGVETRFEADAICGEVEVALASRAPIAGVVVPRVPQALSIAVDEYVGSAWVSRGEYFLEEIQFPQEIDAKTATLWGRTLSAKLTTPWAHKVSKQWPGGETIASIIAEVVNPLGVTFSLSSDYDVCQYCYAVSDQTPAEIIRDLATRSGQIIWPQVDGSITIAPRLYTYGTPDVTLSSDDIIVESLDRQVPDFGNRILVSGDAAVAGIAVQVVPMADEDTCVVADGTSSVRLIAVCAGADGLPLADGTTVTWSASSGLMSAATSTIQSVVRSGESHQSDNYTQLTLDLPAESVIGVYARKDTRRARNLYTERGGSVSGRIITFSAPLNFYDQALIVDYIVKGAPNTWVAGWTPGDVTVLASVAGAQGYATLHQSNPTACATQIAWETSPASPCLGDTVSILLKVLMFGGAGVGAATFGMVGCGTLTSTRKILTPRTITETLRTSIWGGTVEVRLSAVPASGTTPTVYLAEDPEDDLYDSHDGQTIILTDDTILPGTQVDVTYSAGGTALIGWKPSAIPSGHESIIETLLVTHALVEGDTVAQVTLTRTPVAAPTCIPELEINDFYASHDVKLVTLLEDDSVILPVGTPVTCSYQSVWLTQPGCSATITVRVEDGSEDGGRSQLAVSARDCRTVNPSDGEGSTYDPNDPTQIPDDTPGSGGGETGQNDPTSWLEPEEEAVTPTGCGPVSINKRTPVINPQNFKEVFGIPKVDNCPGVCTCDEICTSLRSTGRLSIEGNMTYSTCVKACQDTRDGVCESCTLSGPATLAPGETGTWVDDKGNNGMFKSVNGPTLTERTPDGGYKAVMPSGGTGPFTVQVCYGDDARQCCETEVDFPPCSISGPSELAQGQEGEFVPSLGMTGAAAVPTRMEIVRTTATAFIAKLMPNACDGALAVNYGGLQCGSKTVEDSYAGTVGAVAGESTLEAGETGYYAHSLGPGASYTGTLTLMSGGSNGAVLMMPEDAEPGASYSASWTGRCGASAGMSVIAQAPCLYDLDGLDPADAGTYPHIGQWIYNGQCYQKVTAYYTTASFCDVPEDDTYELSPCNWDFQISGAVKIFKVTGSSNCAGGSILYHYVWTIGERTWGANPCL